MFFPFFVWWCCLVSSFFWVTLRFPSPFTWCCLVPSFFGWCCCFFFSCLVVLSSFHFLWVRLRSPSLLLNNAVWSPPPLGGVAFPFSFCVIVPYFPSFGWCCLVSSFFWGVAVFPTPFAWCCLPFTSFGWDCVPLLFYWIMLSGLLLLWVGLRFPSPFAWSCLTFPPLGGAAWSPPSFGVLLFFLLLLRGVVFLSLPLGETAFPFSSIE